jgi:biotin synthase
MMGRWGLEGMSSFEQVNVAQKEGERLLTSEAVNAQAPGATEAQKAI